MSYRSWEEVQTVYRRGITCDGCATKADPHASGGTDQYVRKLTELGWIIGTRFGIKEISSPDLCPACVRSATRAYLSQAIANPGDLR